MFCFTVFAMDLRLASYNLHGFKNGKFMLNDLLKNIDLVFVQEH